ncbi:hypothetical protein Syncc8109_0616 [Synechococcus sp. WH 8109]|nr:hypothetical protein Syncc8109_0616 [Synechococcus sp. WH 8109]
MLLCVDDRVTHPFLGSEYVLEQLAPTALISSSYGYRYIAFWRITICFF